MLDWELELRAAAHRARLEREAGQARALRLAPGGGRGAWPPACRLLCWLGRQLARAGARLQARYGAELPPLMAHTAVRR
jgi:hypothetical protein